MFLIGTVLRLVILSCLSLPSYRGNKPSRSVPLTTLKAVDFHSIPDPADPLKPLLDLDPFFAKPPKIDAFTSGVLKTKPFCSCLFHYWLMMTAVHWKREANVDLKMSVLVLITSLRYCHYQ